MSIKKQKGGKLRELSDSIRKNSIRVIGIPEEEEMEKAVENLFKQIVNKNSPNLWEKLDPESKKQTEHLITSVQKKPSPWHIVLKLSKINYKERILKAARGKK